MPTDVVSALESAKPEDIVETFDQLSNAFTWAQVLNAALLFLICAVIMKVVITIADRAMKRLRVEAIVHKFIRSCMKVLMWLVTILLVAAYMNVPVNSLLALLGIVGVALSLALQGILSNLAGGIMVLLSKPFAVGDFVEAGGMSGTVLETGLVYTTLSTVDNKVIYVPNGEISGEKIVNYNAQKQRRVDMQFNISYEDDAELAKKLIHGVVGAHAKALFTPAPFVRVSAYNEGSVSVTLRVWCAAGDYWDLYYDLLEQVRGSLEENGISLSDRHLNVRLKQEG